MDSVGRDKRLRSLTLRQIQRAHQIHSEAPFTVDGHEVKNVTTVAQVLDYEQNDTGMITYTLADGTGRLKARQFLRSAQEAPFQEFDFLTREVQYIRVIGTIKNNRGYNGITVNQARRLDDPHELYYHLLDAMTGTCSLEVGPPPSTSTAGEYNMAPDPLDEAPPVITQPATTSPEVTPPPTSPARRHESRPKGATVARRACPEDITESNVVPRLASPRATSPGPSHIGHDGSERPTHLQQAILREVRRSRGSGLGASVKSIAIGIKDLQVSVNAVEDALDSLVDDDFIFATTSEHSHYRLTVKGLASCFAG